ncbi:uncharacterized pyrophosphatase/phosphodiesterase C725.05c-like [Andrographis paniculata]|uniref:uncharacterized pyrophosphatase/phosphodiesterase C725.05c-like n=1 Tax=Andrographis paniculata TaxID=175694 RepID=UPI0021E8C709|nr:uncharacterized pyrophosphatase/phosphodiesterase C725.05c-like [Andrographis paniculata]
MPFSDNNGDSQPSSPLLSSTRHSQSQSQSNPRFKTFIIFFIFLLLAVTAAISATGTAAVSFSSSSPELSRPLKKLKKPVVLLISSDGFRFGYQFKTNTPNINLLARNGTSTDKGLIPVFPTLTFPNHYSIATGLYPAYHGIVNNYFTDPATGEKFSRQSKDPKWWLGEPLWETAANHGLKAAAYFWPGSEVKKGKWDCPKDYCFPYNETVPFEERVDTILSYFDLAESDIPSLIALYLSDPDSQGHDVGPDDPRINTAVSRIDSVVGRIIQGLKAREIFDDVTIILVGDHGMVGTCDKKRLFLDDLKKWIVIPPEWMETDYPVLGLRPPAGNSSEEIVRKIKEGLNSGEVENGEFLKIYLKEELPSRMYYNDNDRIPPILGLLEEGFMLEPKRNKELFCGGAHGYDNTLFSMRTIFYAHGPRFGRGRVVGSFENVQIYNMVATILGIPGAPNNGSATFANSVLLPKH